jgi:hypothetical protein
VGLVCLSPKMSKGFAASTKILNMSKTSSLSMIESEWIIVQKWENGKMLSNVLK